MSFASYPPFPRSYHINITCLSPHTRRFQEVNILLKYLLTQNSIFLIITQIALQLTSAHSYGGSSRVGRNEIVTGVKAILRISVAKLVFGFCRIIWIWATAWKFESFCMLFFEWSGGGKLYLKKNKEKEPIGSLGTRDYDLHINLDQLYQFINESP